MDFFQILSDIEKVDPEVYDRFDSRRRVFKHLGSIGKKLSAAALPAVMGTMFNKAYGQGSPNNAEIAKVLNLALALEYLEFYFYNEALTAFGNTLPDRPGIELIRNDESGHIKTLRAAITTLGQTPLADPGRAGFDYTGGSGSMSGPFATVFTSLPMFYGVARSFVDTGVRAYKGGAGDLFVANAPKDLLQAALNIHSVEARHGSHIRAMQRGGINQPGDMNDLNTKPKSWISGTDNGGASPNTMPSTTPIYGPGTTTAYPAESNVTHLGVDVAATTTFPTIGGAALTAAQKTAAATEAFDEPLNRPRVIQIADPFVTRPVATLLATLA